MIKVFTLLFFTFSVLANDGKFSGRIFKINEEAKTVQIKVDFNNVKYINIRDQVQFWREIAPQYRCHSIVQGRTNNYLMLKIDDFNKCSKEISLFVGSYMIFFSRDLVNNIKMGKSLIGILLKKKIALEGIAHSKKVELDSFIEKVEAVNKRYQTLRDKLEMEWRKQISLLESDRINVKDEYSKISIKLMDVNKKLELYRINDNNLSLDRWALDPKLYYRK